jgi:putative addiction module component (TIGR02574 family)
MVGGFIVLARAKKPR